MSRSTPIEEHKPKVTLARQGWICKLIGVFQFDIFARSPISIFIPDHVRDRILISFRTDLAAFANALERRRSDYTTLRAGLLFPSQTGVAGQANGEADLLDEFKGAAVKALGVEDCHALVSWVNGSWSA